MTYVLSDPPLTLDETANALNVKLSTVYELLKEGSLTSVKIRGATRVKSSEVTRFYDTLPPAQYKPLGRKQGVHQ